MDLLLAAARCVPCAPVFGPPAVALNGHTYSVLRLLGEGGFSYVYLVAPRDDPAQRYALKTLRCPYGRDDATFQAAALEVQNYLRFAAVGSPHIIRPVAEAVVAEPGGASAFHVLLPYYERSLQDVLAAHVLGGSAMAPPDVARVFVGILRGVQRMHRYRRPAGAVPEPAPGTEASPMLGVAAATAATELAELAEECPYAHRDLKPANVMLAADGRPVLADLGSCRPARVHVALRQQALALADYAQEHCTLAYRAPELLDVALDACISEASDVWSLGCVLYACCFGLLPFERMERDQGASLRLAVSQGRYEIPRDTRGLLPQLLAVIRLCLVVDPARRPSVDVLLERCLLLPESAAASAAETVAGDGPGGAC
ncbi:kinase-like protein [Metschnikowia bicuspidata var. bicuspidata NRRL YB-4993]|uniref:non-specific serine/threonine protein kinase n=1 Tax=Metschnikowia bicuspidata var. bicuspidata NRRL YB-4993 TaxID=869754 RepID=A0A1A0HDR8_9ASCO|nr:kinase-like protein [Metschnikowia bicuspidata var. bicuspidata NRRL YB-4993]OBA22068.1 kinase-like protein [Metschnikowia bicuspidata var. bicuspidata NRRL YB-4993]